MEQRKGEHTPPESRWHGERGAPEKEGSRLRESKRSALLSTQKGRPMGLPATAV